MRRLDKYWILGFCMIAANVSAQPPKPACSGCEQVAQELKRKPFASYPETKAQTVIDSYCGLFARPAKIYPKRSDCGEAIYSQICEADGQKYIFYTENFLDQLDQQSPWGDQFILAHEIAHHLLGHTERAYRLVEANRKGDARKAANAPYDAGTYSEKRKRGAENQYSISIPQRHLHELEADALALWMVIQRKATRNDMLSMFRSLPKLLSVYHQDYDPKVASNTHPSLYIRERLLERYWDMYEKKALNKRIAAIDDENNYKLLAQDTEAFYAFQLLTADKAQQDQFNATERSIRDSLNRRSPFFFELIVGGMVQQPSLRRQGVSVSAAGDRSLTAGVRLGVGRWYERSRLETDIKLAGSSFSTQAQLADGLQTVERFQSLYLYAQPRYVYSRLERMAKYAYRTSGLMGTVGFSVVVPLQFSYTNYVANTHPAVGQRPGAGLVGGLGYGISNWINSNGHFRIWLLYAPHWVNIKTAPAEPIRAWQHTVSLDLSFRFW